MSVSSISHIFPLHSLYLFMQLSYIFWFCFYCDWEFTIFLLLTWSQSILFWPWAEFFIIPIVSIGSWGFLGIHIICKLQFISSSFLTTFVLCLIFQLTYWNLKHSSDQQVTFMEGCPGSDAVPSTSHLLSQIQCS